MAARVNSWSRISVAVAGGLCLGCVASAGQAASLHFRDDVAEMSAATRLLSAYGMVTSTFRTIAHNRAVGGVPNSYHLLNRAIDVARRPGVTHRQIEAALKRSGYMLIESLDEHDHSHFAFAALPLSSAPISAVPTQITPTKPLLPRVAADDHGTLSLDLGAPNSAIAAGPFRPRSPRAR